MDAVLLFAAEDLIPPDEHEALEPLMLGEVRSLEPVRGCFATGFPRVGRDSGTTPRAEQFWGTLAPGVGSGNGKLVLSSEGIPPHASQDEKSPWSGLSGAAVFFRNFLIGLIVEDDRPGRWRHSRVGVLTIARLFEDTSFIDVLRQHLGRALVLNGITEQEIADAEFEHRYAQVMRAEHGKIRIFGLDLSRSNNRGLDLETAYLSLEAVSSGSDYDRTGEHDHDADLMLSSAKVEMSFRGKHRILLRGQAGSGKSTLMQWLAIKSASGGLSGELSVLNNRVPFILRLRAMYRLDNLHPSPSQFLGVGNILIASDQPNGWADRVLRDGRALLLVDGMDEIPDEKRDEAREWLGWILEHYPNVWVLVTVRPSAVPPAWLRDYHFDELALLPMNGVDRSIFIEKWHQAAALESSAAPGLSSLEHERVAGELRELQENLKRALEVTPQLAALTDSPLLCAMICALHRDRNGALPNGRMEIYKAALGMLLARRDQERQVELELEEDEHRAFLQEIAAWLVGEGLVEGGRSDAEHQIERMLPSLNQISHKFSVEQLYDHIVERSGLLTETTTETFEFIHRTFQDYLAAQEFKEARNFKMLAGRAHEEQWGDVIRMAVGHCDYRDRAILLRNIIDEADASKDEEIRREIHLLAGSCLPYATRLDASIRTLVLDRVLEHMHRIEYGVRGNIEKLAAIGDDLISVLPAVNAKPWVIDVLGEIRSERALEALMEISQSSNESTLNHIMRTWRSFDAKKFAEKILTQIDCSKLTVWVSERDQLAELKKLGSIRRLVLDGATQDWNTVESLEGVETPVFGLYNTTLRDLEFLRQVRNVRNLDLFGCWGLVDISVLSALELETLNLVDLMSVESISSQLSDVLSAQSQVKSLGLGFNELETLDQELRLPNVSTLKLWYPRRGVETMRRVALVFPELESLSFYLPGGEERRVIDLSPFSGKEKFLVHVSGGSVRPSVRGRRHFAPGSLMLDMIG
ncbi:NACHT domain-containing protein [Streptomyces sp. NPDC047917]|uniref:NACHT domain-containing protein n=1 Tax=Streptomyces sp. NPDC047917 TaxID=3365491 RepID=UPI0037129996